MPNKSTNVRPNNIATHALRMGFTLLRPWPGLAARWAEGLFFSPPRGGRRGAGIGEAAERRDVALDGSGAVATWTVGRGPVVYLLHGWGGSAAQLRGLVPPLLAEGFTVVAMDAPGHGASAGTRSSIPEFARALSAVVARYGPAHAVVTHSLGGAALAVAMGGGLAVGRAVLVGPPADPVAWTRMFADRLAVGASALARMQQRTEDRLRIRWSDLHVPTLAARFAVPALVVHDRGDREVPWREGAAVAAAWPGATLLTTTGLGHRRILQDPAVTRTIAAFVAGCRAGESARCASCGRPTERPGKACRACEFERYLFERDERAAAPWAGAPARLSPCP
jgi:pimeloyl-ACP methyl ester carboxylesterase